MPPSRPLILSFRQLVVVCCFCCPFVLCPPLVRGSSSALPANKFFGAGDLTFRMIKNPKKKQTDAEQREADFSTQL